MLFSRVDAIANCLFWLGIIFARTFFAFRGLTFILPLIGDCFIVSLNLRMIYLGGVFIFNSIIISVVFLNMAFIHFTSFLYLVH